jgi:hypothetical protein
LKVFLSNGMPSFSSVFWFKIMTLGLVYYFVKHNKAKQLYYYLNAGVSPVVLWVSTLAFDFFLFIFLLVLVYQFR